MTLLLPMKSYVTVMRYNMWPSHWSIIFLATYNTMFLETSVSVTDQNKFRCPVWLAYSFLTTFSMSSGSRKRGIFGLGAAIQVCHKEWTAVVCDVYHSTTQRSPCNHGQANSQKAQPYSPKVSYYDNLYWYHWFEFLWLVFPCWGSIRLVTSVTWCTLYT